MSQKMHGTGNFRETKIVYFINAWTSLGFRINCGSRSSFNWPHLCYNFP